MIFERSAGYMHDMTLHIEAGSPPLSLDEADAFRLAQVQPAGVSPALRITARGLPAPLQGSG